MIKRIYFKNDNNINNNDEFVIEFTKHTNIIIGPKGGGKSSLLNLLVGATNGYISKGVFDTFKEENSGMPYIPIKIEKFSGEIIKMNSLEKKPIKEFEGKVNKLNNVIWQNDKIKSKLDDVKEINKEKKEFIEELISGNEDIRIIIDKMKGIHQDFKKLFSTIDETINWNNIYKITDKKEENDLIVELKYSNKNEILENERNSDEIEKILKNMNDFYNISIKTINHNHFIKNDISEKELREIKHSLIENMKKLLNSMKKKDDQNKKINKTLQAFEISLKNIKAKIINDSNKEKLITKFITDAKFHFENMAKIIKKIKINLNNFLSQNNEIEIIMNKIKNSEILTLQAETATLEREKIINILSKILYKPGSVNDVENWINVQIKKNTLKDFSEKSIQSLFKNFLLENVHVMANGKKYSSLSNGQKSIFGIKFKLKKAKLNSEILFLDQPEDNLDNETIKKELVSIINQFDCQKIIITHNANIGLLTKVDNVIVANFKSDKKPYFKGNTRVIKNHSDAANYLEGGVDALDERRKIIIGENNGN